MDEDVVKALKVLNVVRTMQRQEIIDRAMSEEDFYVGYSEETPHEDLLESTISELDKLSQKSETALWLMAKGDPRYRTAYDYKIHNKTFDLIDAVIQPILNPEKESY